MVTAGVTATLVIATKVPIASFIATMFRVGFLVIAAVAVPTLYIVP